MNERRGVALVMFDLPVRESEERRRYTRFRKALMQRGYRCFQRSVYIRLLRNISSGSQEIRWLNNQSPPEGSVQVITMNLNVFRTLTAVRGEEFNMSLFADDVVFIGDDSPDYPPEIDDASLLDLLEQLKQRSRRENEGEAFHEVDEEGRLASDEDEDGDQPGAVFQTDLF